jgi:hypothetical protein
VLASSDPDEQAAAAGPARQRRIESGVWWMSVLFACGSACFVVASIPGFVEVVGSLADAVVYFVGSIFFTSAATLQWFQSGGPTFPLRQLGWWSAAVQLVGTLYFNATTFRALQSGLDANEYDRLVWSPDALGSICFLLSSYLACVELSGLSARPMRTRDSVIATANLVGSVAFGIAAVASFVVPSTGDTLDLAAANLFTALGGVCFFLGAVLLRPASSHQDDAGAVSGP